MTTENVTTKNGPLTAEVLGELARAEMKFPAFNSAHEGYAVLLEEVEELKAEVFHGPVVFPPRVMFATDEAFKQARDEARIQAMRTEAIQVAAMAIRFLKDVTDRPPQTVRALVSPESMEAGNG